MHGRNTALALATLTALTACGSSGTALQSAILGLPTTQSSPLAPATTYTSPDGGIYRNPLHLDVLLLTRRNVAQLAKQLGTSDWQPLTALGDFTVIVIRLRNDGKAFSDPEVRDLQIASDHAPPQSAQGPLHHFYHPTYALAAVATTRIDDKCRPHLDPGQSTVVVLVYTPVQVPDAGIVWGRYKEFAL